MKFYNSHIHTFIDKDIPNKYLPFGIVPILRSKVGYKLFSGVLKHIIPFTDEDMFDRYNRFIEIGRYDTQQEIFDGCKIYYPSDTEFIVLPMDMAFMGAGKVPRLYDEQIDELGAMAKKSQQVIPFIHIDPRRKNMMDLLKRSVEELGFKGVKLYPNLGCFPYDEAFYPVYEYLQANNLPIIAHCSPYNPVHFKGSKKELTELLSKSKEPIDTKGKKVKELCCHFGNPLNYEYVIKDFPKLRICLAHWGSEYYWEKYMEAPQVEGNWFVQLKEMIEKHETIYTDISFTLNNQKYFPLLKVLLNDPKINSKILFGSDYYMVETQANERRFGIDLRACIGENNFQKIAINNVEAFLGKPPISASLMAAESAIIMKN